MPAIVACRMDGSRCPVCLVSLSSCLTPAASMAFPAAVLRLWQIQKPPERIILDPLGPRAEPQALLQAVRCCSYVMLLVRLRREWRIQIRSTHNTYCMHSVGRLRLPAARRELGICDGTAAELLAVL
jgi:hypothetical protein